MTETSLVKSRRLIQSFDPFMRRVRASEYPDFARLHGEGLGVVQLGRNESIANATKPSGEFTSRFARADIDTPVLFPAEPFLECWRSAAPGDIHAFRHGVVCGRADGSHLFATLSIDDTSMGIREATRYAYETLFAALDSTAYSHILKIWNYLPAINEVEGGQERYRSFNSGRFDAIQAAGRELQMWAPAACALGTPHGGKLQIHWIASCDMPQLIENPRQVSAYHYPAEYGARSPNFSRAALTRFEGQWVLLISGTASIVGHASHHSGDVRAQTRETLANLDAVVREANRVAKTNQFSIQELVCTVYVRHRSDLEAVRSEMAANLGKDASALHTAAFLQADVCRSELLVEIEATGFAMVA